MPYNSELTRPLTSIVSYPERGAGGNNRYRGNCSPKLIEDLIGFFKPKEICDYMQISWKWDIYSNRLRLIGTPRRPAIL